MSHNKILPGLNLTVIISGALVYLEKIPSAGHIQVKSGFQVKRNSNHYRCVYILFLWV